LQSNFVEGKGTCSRPQESPVDEKVLQASIDRFSLLFFLFIPITHPGQGARIV
jgi:hypothetical protein